MKKFITTILIIGLVLSLNFNLFLFKPKQAKALDAGGSWATAIKETVLDAIGWTVSDMILKRMMVKIQNWGLGRTNDMMQPFAVSDYLGYFAGALALGTSKYILEFEATKMEPWIKKTLKSLGFGTNIQDMMAYSSYARSTLEQDLGPRYRGFVDSGLSMLKGGWQGWFSLMKPQNDIFGQILMADMARGNVWESYVEAEKKAADTKIKVSGGYRDETTTTETDRTACIERCELDGAVMFDPYIFEPCVANCGQYIVGSSAFADCIVICEVEAAIPNPEYEICMEDCEKKPGVPIATKIKNIGADIHKQMDDALSADMQRIISVDEISQLIGIFFSAITNKMITGMGRMFSPSSTYTTSVARSELKQDYSYNKSFKEEQTSTNRKNIRANILSNILKSMQQLSRSIISCEEKEMMAFEDYSKNLADILDAQVEALYVGLEGINLKPDFEILDPQHAPFFVYGYSWNHVPANKIPSKCRTVIDQYYGDDETHLNATCGSIKSGLEPNYNVSCEQCIYDHNALACPGATVEIKQEFYNNCREWYNIALNRCENCLEKVDEQCSEFGGEEKEQCIIDRELCNEYQALIDYIIAPPENNIAFYNQCLIEEKKEACYVCLKEYFVPATYCVQIRDYMARSVIKYPALVKWERTGDDKGMWIGPYDEAIGDRGGECDTNYEPDEISLSLVCRIMPDFKYDGQELCETKCKQQGMTVEQLRDTTDFRPHDGDCGNYRLPKSFGGNEPWEALNEGTMHVRGKCCATFWQHDSEQYSICIGQQ